MNPTATALWLDTSLAGFDHFFLNIQHVLADKLGFVLTPLMKVITFLGEKGWVFFVLALLFMLMADKRDLGVCIFGAVCCGALITNIILKDNVARIRPFENSLEYELWWLAIGSPAEDGFSFPSGHVTACAAGMTAIICMRGKKWILPSAIIVALMAISRNYLMAHYPSDVLVAAIIGLCSGIIAWLITKLIFRLLKRYRESVPICAFILDFDIRDVLPFGDRPAPAKKAAPARSRHSAAKAEAEEAPQTRRRRIEVPIDNKADVSFEVPGTRAPAAEPTVEPRRRTAQADEPVVRPDVTRRSSRPVTEPKKTATRRSGGYQGKH